MTPCLSCGGAQSRIIGADGGWLCRACNTTRMDTSEVIEGPVELLELRLPKPIELRLVDGWEDRVASSVAEQARMLNEGHSVAEVMEAMLPPPLKLKTLNESP